jgi:hypothetical protein
LLLVLFLISAGCMSVPSPDRAAGITVAPSPATALPTGVSVTVPTPTLAPAETAVIIMAPLTTEPKPSPSPTWVYQTYDATGGPRILVLEFHKSYFNADLPDCGMRMFFPDAANDPLYGIASRQGKLIAYTEDDIRKFLETNAVKTVSTIRADRNITDYIEPATLGGPACSATVSTPTWNFVLINATIIGRNAVPSEFAIGFNVRSKGTVVAQIRADRNITLDTVELFALWVPLKTTETDLFDSVEMVFVRRGH